MIKKVEVVASMKPNEILPLKIIWEDGKEYEIERVKDTKKMASTKGGGAGVRYECKISGKMRYLYLDDDVWFVEIL